MVCLESIPVSVHMMSGLPEINPSYRIHMMSSLPGIDPCYTTIRMFFLYFSFSISLPLLSFSTSPLFLSPFSSPSLFPSLSILLFICFFLHFKLSLSLPFSHFSLSHFFLYLPLSIKIFNSGTANSIAFK